MHKLHTEFKDTIALENATGKMYVRGFDKEGAALIYMRPVNENTKDHAGNIKHLVYSMERAVACMDAKGMGSTKLSLVIDYGGYNSSHAPTMKTSKETLNILQNHYPERLKCAYCLRAPFMFYAFFKMVSPFIDPVTKKKICMIKNAEIGNAECQLYKDIDIAVLEESVGGMDTRSFVSSVYLSGPFEHDFCTILDAQGVEREEIRPKVEGKTAETGTVEDEEEAADAVAEAVAAVSLDEKVLEKEEDIVTEKVEGDDVA